MSSRSTEPWLLYDGECPFCSAYVKMVRLKDAAGPVRMVDARQGGPELDEARAAGLDLDQGMVLKLAGQMHHGDACIHRLALMTSPSGAFNRLNAWVFRSRSRSRVLYPVLRTGRNAALRMLGRRGIGA
ncbi:DCC1-like thiol-disulfide oxidoreductase family protein [Citreimonas sp.]|uniref:DCC1-like thiol-disulfide oxidoreductase family protein n=1 Tax=Citreimonas sp. TaxID=3036715 RepID=UPI00405A3303